MANAERGEAQLVAGDKTYVLRLTFNGICELEQVLDMSSAEIDALVRSPTKVRSLQWRALLWGCLRDRHPDVDLEGAGRLFDEAGTEAAVKAIYDALRLSQPEKKAGAENPRKASPEAG